MKIDYSYIKDQYPDRVSLEQLCRICHFSKRKGKWLLEHRIIPCTDSKKKTKRFLVKADDVITYLSNEAAGDSVTIIPSGIFSSYLAAQSHRHTADQRLVMKLNNPKFRQAVYRFYEKKYQSYPDALDVESVSKMTGFGNATVNNWIGGGKLKIYSRMERIIPKIYLLEFCCSRHFITICCQSEMHREDILLLQEMSKKYSEGNNLCLNTN